MSNRRERPRRAADERRRAKEWRDSHEDTGGAFRLGLYRRDRFDLAVYVAARLTGDVQAAALGAALENLVEAAAEGRLLHCLICGAPPHRLPLVIAVMVPERPDPSTVMASGFCTTCAAMNDADILARAEQVLRQGAWPETSYD
jgi:hypothetical protein